VKSLLHLAADRYAAQYDDAHKPSAEQLLHDLTYYDGLAHHSPDGEALLVSLRAGNVVAELIRAIEDEITPGEITPCSTTGTQTTETTLSQPLTDEPESCSGE
jgi:hypothetical protein